jgi:hypothetical protein
MTQELLPKTGTPTSCKRFLSDATSDKVEVEK